MSRRGAESEEDTESEAGSGLWAVSTEPDSGLDLTNHEIMTWVKIKSWMLNQLSHPRAPLNIFSNRQLIHMIQHWNGTSVHVLKVSFSPLTPYSSPFPSSLREGWTFRTSYLWGDVPLKSCHSSGPRALLDHEVSQSYQVWQSAFGTLLHTRKYSVHPSSTLYLFKNTNNGVLFFT